MKETSQLSKLEKARVALLTNKVVELCHENGFSTDDLANACIAIVAMALSEMTLENRNGLVSHLLEWADLIAKRGEKKDGKQGAG